MQALNLNSYNIPFFIFKYVTWTNYSSFLLKEILSKTRFSAWKLALQNTTICISRSSKNPISLINRGRLADDPFRLFADWGI